ncbi:hypothetical protein HMI54_002751 [Coelomomyces lativittatus]|nr:hypothetical protein HMI56_006941 [Coelomomyces lativittatus]KAJ1518058.1 hypothetical protein HMI54_002751 [Coelomomyces lativittatus]
MTKLLNEVDEYDAKLAVVLDSKRQEREEANAFVINFEKKMHEIVSEKRSDLEEKANDLRELTRVIKELHLLKVCLKDSPNCLRDPVSTLIHSKQALEDQQNEEQQWRVTEIKSVEPKELKNVMTQLKTFVNIHTNQSLKDFFDKFTVPIYQRQLRLKHELDTQKYEQSGLLEAIQVFEAELKQ